MHFRHYLAINVKFEDLAMRDLNVFDHKCLEQCSPTSYVVHVYIKWWWKVGSTTVYMTLLLWLVTVYVTVTYSTGGIHGSSSWGYLLVALVLYFRIQALHFLIAHWADFGWSGSEFLFWYFCNHLKIPMAFKFFFKGLADRILNVLVPYVAHFFTLARFNFVMWSPCNNLCTLGVPRSYL